MNAKWAALALAASLSACNCGHPGSQLTSKDSTPSVSPDPVSFGDVPLGQTKPIQVTLTNTGTLELDITGVTLSQASDGGVPQFTFASSTNATAPFGASLQPGDAATASLQCQPNQPGAQAGTLAIKSNSDGVPVLSVPLQCNAIDVVIVAQPTSLNFGNVQVSTQSTLPVTLTNTGSTPSALIKVAAIAGTQAAEFAWSGTPSALASGQSFTLQVTFSPTQQGSASAMLPFSYCAGCSSPLISLSGAGVDGQLVYSPNPVSFNNVPAGNSVSSPPVTLSNIGTAAVLITPFEMQSGNTTPFSLGGYPAMPIALQPGTSFQFDVTYTATAAGNDADAVAAQWVPLDAAGNAVVGISPRIARDPVTGNGSQNPCTLQIQPASLNFGTVAVGVASQKSVTLTNVGQRQCDVSAIMLGPGTDPAFSLAAGGPTSLTLAPTQSGTIDVSCDVSSGSNPLLHKGTLAFQSNDPTQANASVPLTAAVQGSSPYAAGWPKWHNDNTDQGQSNANTAGDVGNLVWKFQVGVPQTAPGPIGAYNPIPTYMNSPVVDSQGNVYQLGMGGTFYAIGPAGNQLWIASLLAPNPDEHPATPIIAADGTIYVESGTDNPDDTAQLYHLDSTTGAILFSAGPPTGQNCDPNYPCFSDGDCGGGSCNQNSFTCCFNADGFDVNPSLGSDGLLFDGDDFGQIVAYAPTATSFTQADEVILEFYGERVAVALDADDNSYWCSLNVCYGITSPAAGFTQMPAWPAAGAPIGNAGSQSSCLSNGGSCFANADLAYDASFTGWLMVETGTQNGSTGWTEVVAMDPTNGSLHWDVTLPQGPTPGSFNPSTEVGIFSSDVGNSAPAIDAVDGTVYVGNVDGLYALVGATGAIKAGFPFKTSSDVDSAPAIGGDRTVFFGTADGTFYAVNPNGSQRYSFKAGGRISSSPAIGPDGTVFFVADDGFLYAIR